MQEVCIQGLDPFHSLSPVPIFKLPSSLLVVSPEFGFQDSPLRLMCKIESNSEVIAAQKPATYVNKNTEHVCFLGVAESLVHYRVPLKGGVMALSVVRLPAVDCLD